MKIKSDDYYIFTSPFLGVQNGGNEKIFAASAAGEMLVEAKGLEKGAVFAFQIASLPHHSSLRYIVKNVIFAFGALLILLGIIGVLRTKDAKLNNSEKRDHLLDEITVLDLQNEQEPIPNYETHREKLMTKLREFYGEGKENI